MHSDLKLHDYESTFLLQKSVKGAEWVTMKEYKADETCRKALQKASAKLEEKGRLDIRLRAVIRGTLLRSTSYYAPEELGQEAAEREQRRLDDRAAEAAKAKEYMDRQEQAYAGVSSDKEARRDRRRERATKKNLNTKPPRK